MAQQLGASATLAEDPCGSLQPSIALVPGYLTSVALLAHEPIHACRQNTHAHKIKANTAFKTYCKELLSKENI